MVYVGNGGRQLFVCALDQLEPTPIAAGSGLRGVFVAPDGQWAGYVDNNTTLLKVALSGGPATRILQMDAAQRGATWAPDDTVTFATSNPTNGLQRVSSAGGEPTVLTRPDRARGEGDHMWPEMMPGGRAVLFTITALSGNPRRGANSRSRPDDRHREGVDSWWHARAVRRDGPSDRHRRRHSARGRVRRRSPRNARHPGAGSGYEGAYNATRAEFAWRLAGRDVSVFCFEGARCSSIAASSVPRMRAIVIRALRCASCEAPHIAPTHLPVFPNHPSCLVPFDARSERECSCTSEGCQRLFAGYAQNFDLFFSTSLCHPTDAGRPPKPLW